MANFDSPFDDIKPSECIKGVQNNPVYVPRLSLPDRDMDPLVPIAAGSLQHVIQETANDSVLRQSLFMNAAKNQFNNGLFDRMCKMVVELADIESRKSRLPDEELCDKAAEIVTHLYSALESDADRSLERYLTDGQMRKVDEAMRTYDTLTEDIQNFYNGRRNDRRGRDDRDRDYRDRDSRRGGYRGDDRGRDRDRGRREPTRGGRGWDAGNARSTTRERGAYGGDNNSQTDSGDAYHHGRVGRVEKEKDVPNTEPAKNGRTTPPVPKRNLVQQISTIDLYEYLQPNVYPLVYIHGEQVPFFVKKDGIYVNSIVTVEEAKASNMEYSDHATDHLLVSRTAAVRDTTPDKSGAQEAVQRLEQMERVEAMLKRLETQSGEEAGIKEGGQCNLILSGYMSPIQEEDYWAPAQARLAELPGMDVGVEDAVIAYTVATPAQWVVSDGKTGILMDSMTKARTWDELKALLVALRPPTLPIYYWEMLHTAITDYVNFYVHVVLNVDVTISSFVDDLSSLDEEMEKEEEHIQKLFQRGVKDIVAAVANCGRADVMSSINGEPWDPTRYCLVTLDNVILLPVTTTDLSLACAGEVGAVTPTTIPWLYNALAAIFPQLTQDTRYNKVVTADGGIYYVVPNKLYEGFVITNHCDFS